MTATGHYDNGKTYDITRLVKWLSSDLNSVFVTSDGVAITNKPSPKVVIDAELSGVRASDDNSILTIEVLDAEIVDILLNPIANTIPLGFTFDFQLTALLDNGTTLLVDAAKANFVISNQAPWNPSNTQLAEINGGKYKALAQGTLQVKATYKSATSSKPANITNINSTLLSLEISTPKNVLWFNNSPISGLNNPSTLRATALATLSHSPGDKINITDTVSWSSSNPTVAIVSTGNVTALKPGVTTIKAVSNEGIESNEIQIEVKELKLVDFNIWFGNDPQFSVNPSILKSSPFNNNIHSVTNSKGNFYVEGVFTDASLNNTPNAELPASLLRVSATPKNNYDNADILTMNLAVAEVTLHKFVGSGTLRLEIKNPDGSSVAKDVIVNVDPGLIHLSGYTFGLLKRQHRSISIRITILILLNIIISVI